MDRGCEPELLAELRNEGALLLTGLMLCGKTHTGRSVAKKLQDEGFACRETEDHAEAARAFVEKRAPVFNGR